MTVAEKLQRLTDTQNLTALAHKAGVTRLSLWNTVRGLSDPKRATVAAVAAALNVDAGWLMDDTKDWPPVYLEHQNAVA